MNNCINIQKTIFTQKSRIFLETISGCKNVVCTSPCSALQKPYSFMDTEILTKLLRYFGNNRGTEEMLLYGQGDASVYPFEKIATKYLKNTTVNLTLEYRTRAPDLCQKGITVFLRIDAADVKLGKRDFEGITGVICVVGIKQREIYLSIAKKILDQGIPFCLRSMCNFPNNPELPLDEVIGEMTKKGYIPAQIFQNATPSINCKVAVIRQEGNTLKYKRCILHNKDLISIEGNFQHEEIPFLDLISQDVKKWDSTKTPEDFCLECNIGDSNWRLYYEPN